ncbi:MAG: C-terminal binding protein [Thermoplasmatales archaeon]|jgi:D-3-phosphoglycerate dehydrogenase|nr:C-terminal binding protein [Thermoplasmatales archaeon]
MKNVILKTDGDFRDVSQERKILESAGYELVERNCQTSEDVIGACNELKPSGLIVLKVPISAEVMKKAPTVKVISRYGIGLDMIDLKGAEEEKIPVAYVPDYCVDEVSNHAISLMLSSERRLLIFDRNVRKGDWGMENISPVHRFSEKTVGLLGFGRLAQAVAGKLKGFGTMIAAYDPFLDENFMRARGVQKVQSVDDLLRISDILSIHVPLTKETKGIITKEELRRMKKGAVIVNTSRGGIVDQKALLGSIKEGHLSGAGLDVFEDEPIEMSDPILQEERIVLTPHVSYYSEEALKQVQADTAQAVVDILAGKKPRNLANHSIWENRRK